MQDWKSERAAVVGRIGELAKLSPATIQGLQILESNAGEQRHLDVKTRELIALAVAVTTRCDGCISIHSRAAMGNGASHEEIAEALRVAVALNAGAAAVYSARALEACQQQA